MKFHFLTQISTIFGNEGLKWWQCSISLYYGEKLMIFLWKFIIFEQKEMLGLEFSEKHQSELNKFWWIVKQVSYFSMIFKFYMQGLIVSKISENPWFSWIIST